MVHIRTFSRYLLICCPTKQRVSVKMALLLVVIITIISIAVMSPLSIYASYVTMDDYDLGKWINWKIPCGKGCRKFINYMLRVKKYSWALKVCLAKFTQLKVRIWIYYLHKKNVLWITVFFSNGINKYCRSQEPILIPIAQWYRRRTFSCLQSG